MPTIPTWPVVVTEYGALSNANGGAMPLAFVDLSDRILTAAGIKRGKQYELDTAQAGELSTTLRNNDAVLDPTNSSGPFAGLIAPFQPFRMRAQYPATPNLLLGDLATSGETTPIAPGAIPASLNMGTDVSATLSIVSTANAYQGTQVFQAAVPASATPQWYATKFNQLAIRVAGASIAGTTYTFSTYVQCTTVGQSPTVMAALKWYNASGGGISSVAGAIVTMTGTSSSAWQRITVTGQAPAGAVTCTAAVSLGTAASPTVPWTLQQDAAQFEIANTASVFYVPGKWYPLFSGFIERWPTSWKDGGTWGYLTPTVTDAFALLSQGQLSDPLTEEINALNPRFLFRLDDPSSSVQAAEANGLYPPLNVVSGKYGTAPVTFGSSITATDPVNGVFATGGSYGAACIGFNPPSPANTTTSTGASVLSLTESGINGPANPALYTRIIAFRWTGTTVPTNTECLWTSLDNSANGAAGLQLQINPSGVGNGGWVAFGINVTNPTYPNGTGSGPFAVAPINFTPFDGNWHFVAFGYNDTGKTAFLSCDGFTTGMTQSLGAVPGSSGGWTPTIAIDSLGGYLSAAGETITEFQGEIAYAAEFPTNLTAAQINTLYVAWRNACAGESSATRYARILRYAGYTGPTNIDSAVMTRDMGPATDLNGSDALTCLNNVVVTENGTHFVAVDGTITFQGRGYRYNPGTPVYTFGEGSGEFPYEDLQLDYDSTHLANDTTVTVNSSGQNFYAVSPSEETEFFDRTMTRTINVNSPQEAQDCASFLLNRYGQPLTRVTQITLNPGGQPALWPVCLSLELGMLIQINRRPFGCPTIPLTVWIEQMQWDVSDDGKAIVKLQCSPVMATPQAQFAVWQATMYQSAAAGTNFIVVNNATDMANPLDAQLAPGMAISIHSFGAYPLEVLTIKSVQATGTYWTTGQITFTTNLVNTHPASAQVSEANPVPNLNAYNANAAFDSVVFTY